MAQPVLERIFGIAVPPALLRHPLHHEARQLAADRLPAGMCVSRVSHPEHARGIGQQQHAEQGGQKSIAYMHDLFRRELVEHHRGSRLRTRLAQQAEAEIRRHREQQHHHQRHRQQHADVPGLARYIRPRQAGPIVLRRQVAAQRHHGLAGIGLPRAMLRAVAAVVSRARDSGSASSRSFKPHCACSICLRGKSSSGVESEQTQVQVAHCIALLQVAAARRHQAGDQFRIGLDWHWRPP